eukprot:snap_masked-scaffold_39-processed-gene-2.52-mRNA-1 protein AED:1.00 eAED:1.00 QI:0/-1/0/0/-1/1/1/0/217
MDHRAILSVIRTKENEKRIHWDRMYRWVLKLQSVDITVFHISSRDNFVSDLLTCWGKQERTAASLARLHFIQDDDLSSISSLSTLDSVQDSGSEGSTQGYWEDPEQTEDLDDYLQNRSFDVTRVRGLYSIDAVSYSGRMDDFNPEVVRPAANSVNEELGPLINELFQNHIPFLSPFYSGKNDYKLDDRKVTQHQKKLPTEFREEKCKEKNGLIYFRD